MKRSSDLGARYGGDEFAVLLPNTDLEDAAMLAERIREALTLHPGADDVQHRNAHLSIGVACLVPDIGTKHRDLIAAADKALYQAKHLGRNRTELAETDVGGLAPADDADSARASRGKGNPAARKQSSAAAWHLSPVQRG